MMLFPRLAFILSNYFARCNNARRQNEDEEKENRVQSRQHGYSQLQARRKVEWEEIQKAYNDDEMTTGLLVTRNIDEGEEKGINFVEISGRQLVLGLKWFV